MLRRSALAIARCRASAEVATRDRIRKASGFAVSPLSGRPESPTLWRWPSWLAPLYRAGGHRASNSPHEDYR